MKKEVTMIVCDRCGYSATEEQAKKKKQAKDWTSLDGFDMCPYCTRSCKEFEENILKWNKNGLVDLKKILIDGHSIDITLEKHINKEDALDDSGRSGAIRIICRSSEDYIYRSVNNNKKQKKRRIKL